MTLLIEILFLFLVWSKRFRSCIVIYGVMVHVGIELTMRTGPFPEAMLAGYIPFLSGTQIRQWFSRRAISRGQTERLPWQLTQIPSSRWELYYNGDCAFCRKWVRRARRFTLPQVKWLDFQQHGSRVAHLNLDFKSSAYLIVDHQVSLPGYFAFRALVFAMPLLWPLLPLLYLPGSAWIGTRLYRHISIRYGPVDETCSSP